MKRDLDVFLRMKILAVEIASTVVFVALVGLVMAWELRHLWSVMR
jgi:hypothetical protein